MRVLKNIIEKIVGVVIASLGCCLILMDLCMIMDEPHEGFSAWFWIIGVLALSGFIVFVGIRILFAKDKKVLS
ncbi:MAG: hypothetical protein V1809_16800 [Planctomycetota bacterium]